MAGHECYHCKQWVDEGQPHDCWTTTEQALTGDLSDDLRDAWDRLRETAAEFGDQRIYASGSCIMFSRRSCYFFVRPRRNDLELCIFLGRAIKSPRVKRAVRSSRFKVAHTVLLRHRDEVEAPVTEWLREAYDVSDDLTARGRASAKSPVRAVRAAARTAGARAKKDQTRSASRKKAPKKRAPRNR